MKNTRIAVTGAGGMIGKPLVDKLLENGYRVNVLIRDEKKNIWKNKNNVKVIIGDVTRNTDIKDLLKECSGVIHLAAQLDLLADYEVFYKTNVVGVENLIKEIKKKKIRCVMVSTIMVFKDTGKIMRNEKWKLREQEEDNYYVKTKVSALKKIREAGVKVITVFPTIVIDNKFVNNQTISTKSKIFRFLWEKIGGGIPGGIMAAIGDGNRILNVVALDDMAEGLKKVFEKGKLGEEYILGGQNITAKQYLISMGRVLNKNPLKIRIPDWLIKLLGTMSKFLPVPVIFKNMSNNLPINMNFSSKKAERDFDYKTGDIL